MRVVNVHEAKAKLSELLEEAVAGGEVVIARRGKPVVRLVVVEEARPRPVPGRMKGRLEMSRDFDEPLEDFSEYR
ncbi:MAG: type II toxin-antitoxin system prevent-host-death family antitoxin [Thermoanaerobaculia bacterium]|nr:type II toxin-antitoxin system prevent-host-death family antitoxin [Thermoanaerobaculia bacterium]